MTTKLKLIGGPFDGKVINVSADRMEIGYFDLVETPCASVYFHNQFPPHIPVTFPKWEYRINPYNNTATVV